MSSPSGPRLPIVERAYELASSGACSSVIEIERILTSEAYASVHQHLKSTALRSSLRALIKANIMDKKP